MDVQQVKKKVVKMINNLIPAKDDLNGWCVLALKVFIICAITLVAYKLGFAVGKIFSTLL